MPPASYASFSFSWRRTGHGVAAVVAFVAVVLTSLLRTRSQLAALSWQRVCSAFVAAKATRHLFGFGLDFGLEARLGFGSLGEKQKVVYFGVEQMLVLSLDRPSRD